MQTPTSTTSPQSDNLENSRIAQDLQLRKAQVDAAVAQLHTGWAPVFLARYRSENAGGLNEPALRAVSARLRQNRQLGERRSIILRSIESQGQLTDEIRHSLSAADSMRRLEDLFLPFKPRRRGQALAARERGLGPLAEAIWSGDPTVTDLLGTASRMIDPARGLDSAEKVLDGVSALLAETLADQADLRASVRIILNESGILKAARHPRTNDNTAQEFREYFRFSEPMRNIAAHKVFTLRRGEKANALEVSIDWNRGAAIRLILDRLPLPEPGQATSLGEFLANWKPLPVKAKPAPAPATTVEAAPAAASVPAQTEPAQDATAATAEGATAATAEGTSAAAPEFSVASATASGDAGAPVAAGEEAAVGSGETPASTETASAHGETAPPQDHHAEEAAPSEPEVQENSEDPYLNMPAPKFKFAPPSPENFARHPHKEFLEHIAELTVLEFMGPSLERETRRDLGTKADDYAIGICCRTLRMRLLAPPCPGKRVLAIDPASRGGCKVAILDENGDLIEDGSFNPHPPQARRAEPKHKIEEWVRRHQVEVIVLGSGAGFRHVEGMVAEVLQELDDRRHGRIPVVTETLAKEQEAEAHAAQAAHENAGHAAAEESHQVAAPSSETTEQVPDATAGESPEVVAQEGAATETAGEAAPVASAEGEAASGETTPGEAPSGETPSGEAAAAGETPAPGETAPAAPSAPRRQGRHEKGAKKAPTPFVPPSLDHLPQPLESLSFTTVPEVGAGYYGASPLGREELPQQDPALRAVISIGRRFIDSLAEMVKVDPQYLVSGVHASEAQGKSLREALEGVLESVVAQVGLDPNRATVAALRYIPALNPAIARDLIEYRKVIGRFTNRQQLRLIPGMTEDRFVQAVGFLRIAEGDNPLDATWIHPEQYPLAEWILQQLGVDSSVLRDPAAHNQLKAKIESEGPAIEAKAPTAMPGFSNATVRQVLGELIHGGDDVRSHFPSPILRKGLFPIELLEVGKQVEGTVLNVVDFGCFVDIGLKDGGLVHISEMANRFVRSPHEMVHVGEVVRVWIRSVDKEKGRVSLTMIRPGSDRGGPPAHRERGGQRPRRGPGGEGGPGREGRTEGGGGPHQGGNRPPRRDGAGRGPGGPGGPGPGGQGGRSGPNRGGPGRDNQDRGGRGGPPARQLPRGLADLPPRGTSLKQMGRGNKPRPSQPPPAAPAPGATDAAGATAPAEKDKAAIAPQPAGAPKTKREPAKSPVLSQEALKGASPLGTFAELAAFWSASGDSDPKAKPQPAPENHPHSGENPA